MIDQADHKGDADTMDGGHDTIGAIAEAQKIERDKDRYTTLYLQNVDIMKELASINNSLSVIQEARREEKSFASFTSTMITILVVVATISVTAVFSLTHP